jgi:sarcosine oxidase delta subunit
MTEPDIYRRSWTSGIFGTCLACPYCETTGRLEKRHDGLAKCQRCERVFDTEDVLRIDKYVDPNFVKKAHKVARAYHRMAGDLTVTEAHNGT